MLLTPITLVPSIPVEKINYNMQNCVNHNSFLIGSCSHLEDYKSEDVLYSYEVICALYVACTIKNSWRKKKKDCVCESEDHLDNKKIRCNHNLYGVERYRKNIYACLLCPYFGCFKRHIVFHAREKTHPLAVDTNSGRIFCFLCKDYQYDAEFELIFRKQTLIACHKRGSLTGMTYRWEPSIREINLLKKHAIINVSERGVRGLYNMSKISCYMNVIVQSLIHAPIFRDYLLSFKHECEFKKEINDEYRIPSCCICEISDILQKCLLGEKEGPYHIGFLLSAFWQHNPGMVHLDQDDAFLFLNTLLDTMHYECKEPFPDNECECVIHKIFGVILQRELKCYNCKNISTPKDSEWAIKLSLKLSSFDSSFAFFEDCLKRTLKSEVDGYRCNKCSKNTGHFHTQCLEKLPFVLIFNLIDMIEKTEVFVKYGEFLDMSEYILPFLKKKEGNPQSGSLKYKYFLFAVVEHIVGEEEKKNYTKKKSEALGGHYKCYIRQHKQDWFLCNDEVTQRMKKEEVLKIKPYILFYHRQFH